MLTVWKAWSWSRLVAHGLASPLGAVPAMSNGAVLVVEVGASVGAAGLALSTQ